MLKHIWCCKSRKSLAEALVQDPNPEQGSFNMSCISYATSAPPLTSFRAPRPIPHTRMPGYGTERACGCCIHPGISGRGIALVGRRNVQRRASPREDSSGSTSTSGPAPVVARPNLADPVEAIRWGGTLPATRRALLSITAGSAVVLGGNLGGITSGLLSLDGGKLARTLSLDTLVPISTPAGRVKRVIDGRYGFEMLVPADWLADQTVARRAALRAEASRSLDPPSLASRSPRAASVVEPVIAFGPAGTSGEENLSVIVAPITPGFSLASMGSPEKVASQFLGQVAPEGSGRVATLLAASSRHGGGAGPLYYQLEYTIQSPSFYRHNVSVITSRGDQLYTFNAMTPEASWAKGAEVLRASAQSFQLTLSRLNTTGLA